jgi:RNA ligase (TIGR02306 family)
MDRKLASIRKISDVRPIENADAIELVIVDGWSVVTKKGEYKVGDFCVYCEIDSFLPIREEFEFLRKSSYKKMVDKEGFRLKTIRLRNQLSQGLVLPISILEGEDEMKIGLSQQPWGFQSQVGPYDDALVIREGVDVTEYLGIVKYEPPIPAELAGKVKGGFPSFLSKTDEERVQNLVKEYSGWIIQSKHQFYVTEKLDGSSATFYINNGVFGVCSRNLELLETEGNTFWKVARELDLENKMKSLNRNICFQGELIGESVQGNPYKIKGQTVKFFNVFDIEKHQRVSINEFTEIMNMLNLEHVPILETPFMLPSTVEDMLKYAEGKSVLNPNTEREGVVVRSMDGTISFKSISNQFLLNEK